MKNLIKKIKTEPDHGRAYVPPALFQAKRVLENARKGGVGLEEAMFQRQTGRTTRMVLDVISNFADNPEHRALVVCEEALITSGAIVDKLNHYAQQCGITISMDQILLTYLRHDEDVDDTLRREAFGRHVDGIYIDNSVADVLMAYYR